MTHPNSVTDISAVEAVRLEDLDPEAARQGCAKFEQKWTPQRQRLRACVRANRYGARGYVHGLGRVA